MLPEKIPDAFQASYTPIESAGTMEQIMHLARLLSIQMTAVGIGSGVQLAAVMVRCSTTANSVLYVALAKFLVPLIQ